MQIAHRLDVALLALVQLLLQVVELHTEALYRHVDGIDVTTNGIDGATLVCYLMIDDHEVLQTLLHVYLIGAQTVLLLLDLLLNLLTLVLQSLYRGRLDRRLRRRFPLGSRLTFMHDGLLRRLLPIAILLRIGSQREGQHETYNDDSLHPNGLECHEATQDLVDFHLAILA